MSGLKLPVLAKTGDCSDSSDGEKCEAGHFQPELMENLSEGSDRCRERMNQGRAGSAALHLLNSEAQKKGYLPRHLDHDHSVDFSSDRAYNIGGWPHMG